MAHPSPTGSLAVAAGAAAGVAAVYGTLVRTRRGQQLDDRAALATSRRTSLRRTASRALRPYGPVPFGAAATALGVTGLATRGVPRTACASVALLGTVAQVEHLKKNLHRPQLHSARALDWTINSYPSGHSAGVAALAAMAIVLAPHRTPSLATAGLVATCLVGTATVAARWHRPSDVVGGALSAVQWGALGLAAADALDARR